MEDFSYRGKEVKFWRVTGEVIGSDKYSETHVSVSSSGGGGYVGPHGGHISAPNIHTTTTAITNHEFWIKTEEGLEKAIKLRGVDIPLRVGQRITIISACRKADGSGWTQDGPGWYSVLVNHSVEKHWYIQSAEELNKNLQLEMFTGISAIMAGAIAFSIAYFTASSGLGGKNWGTASWELAFWVAGAFFAYRVIVKLSRWFEISSKLKLHLSNLAQFAYKNY
ncbi:MAG: hypothetical protein LRY75_20675 [Shewanella xiamenensis]|uniref:hypothetical protein n=1 Tax=Shewanella xiamenensis TaxID=332186 RepID=UPI0021C1B510|nr:hypothetical protein [Shewanella xiamenensis]MCD8548986.1 hypothetical protein [Shewanella xiamenensis]MCD8561171.1 hypothetical protein [Shewanella xiamenensis]MCT8869480.1 hypothetical protein [Shewanella xiamenensis]MEE1982241.1 hypothetical protein [Shewanella xiamenensis]